MYKYADTTYPLYEAVSMETSLYEAVGLVTFRFELVQALDTLTAFDYFSFTALYRFKDRVRFSDYYRFSVSSRHCDTTVSGDRFRFTSLMAPVASVFAVDAAVFRMTPRFVLRVRPRSVFKVRAANSFSDSSTPSLLLRVAAVSRQVSCAYCGEAFSMGRGTGWRDLSVLFDVFRTTCSFSFVDRSTPYGYFKIKGGKERESEGSVPADLFSFTSFSAYVARFYAYERFRIKNPHSESFLLGASGPANTALGGRTYA